MRDTYSVNRTCFSGCRQCNGSDGIWSSKNAQSVAAKHHYATGHQTWAEVAMTIVYGEEPSHSKQMESQDAQ